MGETTQLRESPCSVKERLLLDYQVATTGYSDSVVLLSERRGVMSKEAYEQILRMSESARMACDRAREALSRHVAEHGY